MKLLKVFFAEYRKSGSISRRELRFVPSLAAGLYCDAFWWCYHIMETEPYRRIDIRKLRRAFKAAKLFYENRKEAEKILVSSQ